MYGYEWMPHSGMGYGMGFGFGGIFMLIFWGLIIFGIVALVKWLFTSPGAHHGAPQHPPAPRRDPLSILEERYARGEIDRDEFLARKQDLQA